MMRAVLIPSSSFCISCRSLASRAVTLLTAEEIKTSISQRDGRLRLTQIPGPPEPIRGGNIMDRLRYEEELARWNTVRHIRMPYEVMYELLMQRDGSLKRVAKSAHRLRDGMTGFNLFLSENSKSLSANLPDVHDGALACRQLTKAAADKWKTINKEEKAEYKKRAQTLRQATVESEQLD